MQQLPITDQTLQSLSTLRAKEKFSDDALDPFYGGAPSEDIRIRCESAINTMLDELLSQVTDNPYKAWVLDVFSKHLKNFSYEDSEEQDEAAAYCERVMDILEIKSSDGLLNTWRYGFDTDTELGGFEE